MQTTGYLLGLEFGKPTLQSNRENYLHQTTTKMLKVIAKKTKTA